MRLLGLGIALVPLACQSIRPVPLGSDSARGQSEVRRSEFAEKVVSMKREPTTFIARDGSRCQVDATTYDMTRVGQKATCMWEFTGR